MQPAKTLKERGPRRMLALPALDGSSYCSSRRLPRTVLRYRSPRKRAQHTECRSVGCSLRLALVVVSSSPHKGVTQAKLMDTENTGKNNNTVTDKEIGPTDVELVDVDRCVRMVSSGPAAAHLHARRPTRNRRTNP